MTDARCPVTDGFNYGSNSTILILVPFPFPASSDLGFGFVSVSVTGRKERVRIGKKAVVLILLDILLVMGSLYLSLALRFDGAVDERYLTEIIPFLPVFALVGVRQHSGALCDRYGGYPGFSSLHNYRLCHRLAPGAAEHPYHQLAPGHNFNRQFPLSLAGTSGSCPKSQ